MMYSSSCFLFLFASALLLSTSKQGYAFESRKLAEETHRHTLQLRSLFPSQTCKPSAPVSEGVSLKVVHKNGPCSPLINQETQPAPPPNVHEILQQDEARVNYLQSKYSKITRGGNDEIATDSTTIPAKDGQTIGSANYVVTVGLGTPKKDLTLIFDTGSDFTWTQCQPCPDRYCYRQREPMFDPTQSSTYTNISCSSALCSSLLSATGKTPRCFSTTCVYDTGYGDFSFSRGFFATERLTVTETEYFDGFYFGCGQNNGGLFRGAAGLLGLGRDKLSFISQTAAKYNKLFSYCLPSTASSVGFLNLGSSKSTAATFTPLSTSTAGPSFYGLDITGISVSGQMLPISPSTFSTAGAIIDSGTVITRLPPAAYSALKSAFMKGMSMYPSAPSSTFLDTCYDLSQFETISVPPISFFFSGGAEVDLDLIGTLVAEVPTEVCLAFAANSDPSDVVIFGNVQQKTLEVVYDVVGGKIGFAKGGCN